MYAYFPTSSESEVEPSVILPAVTVTLQVAVAPVVSVAVIVAVPAFTPVTLPFVELYLETVATLVLLDVHVTVLEESSVM